MDTGVSATDTCRDTPSYVGRGRLRTVALTFLGLATLWSVLLAGLLGWDIREMWHATYHIAATEARAHFNKDQAFRNWATEHGGVYVAVDSQTQPNPYLSHVPERDLTTPSGRKLTLMNPAYMLRQMMADYAEDYGVQGRITSLKPVRPENAPDAWEVQALAAFEQGVKEVSEFTTLHGAPYLRMMRPMVTQEGCLKCHAAQGYKVGDVRGGVGISFPMEPLLALERAELNTKVMSLGIIWAVGLCGLGGGFAVIRRRIVDRSQAEAVLREAHERLAVLFDGARDAIFVADATTGIILEVNAAAVALMERPKEQLVGMHQLQLHPPEDAEHYRERFYHHVRGELRFMEAEVLTGSGRRIAVEISASPITLACGRLVLQGLFRDATAHKQAERLLTLQRDLALAIGVSSGLTETLRLCIEAALAASDMDAGGVYLVEPKTGDLALAYQHGLSAAFVAAASRYAPDSLTARLVQAGKPVFANYQELGIDPDAAASDAPLKALAIVPIRHRNQIIGCLNMASHSHEHVPESARSILEMIAEKVGQAIARDQMLRALRDSEEHYRLLADSIEDFVILVHADGRRLYISPSYYRATGWTPETSLNGDWRARAHPDDVPLLEQARAANLQGQAATIEYRSRLADGSSIWLEARCRPLFAPDGTVEHIVICARDVTRRKAAEQSLRGEAEFRRAIVERAAEGLCVCHETAEFPYVQFTVWNDQMTRLTGYTMEDINRRGWYQSLYPDETQRAQAIDRMARMRQGDDILGEEWEVTRADGARRQLQISTSIVEHSDRSVHVLGLMHDITQRKQAEEQQRQLERQLLHAQKLESLGVLAGGIAHDFNNILAGILGCADLALLRLDATAPVRADIEEIKNCSLRAADLTRQMLAYSGKGRFVVGPLNLSRTAADLRKMLELSVSKKARLEFHLAADLPTIMADAAQIHQVLLNLVINASDALGEQEGSIVVTTETVVCPADGVADLEQSDNPPIGKYACLRVTDTGCGMDPQTQQKIFDPFFTTKFTGRGLGLAAVQGIVRGHRGTIRVRSAIGAGTTFLVFFPASAIPLPTPAATLAAPPFQGHGTVLIVDDDEMVRQLAGRMVEHAGFTALCARDGEEALRIFSGAQQAICCVLLDLTMPKMNGEETLRELRRSCPTVRVILTSGYTAESVAERFSELGLAGFIQKPFVFETLQARLRDALRPDHDAPPPALD